MKYKINEALRYSLRHELKTLLNEGPGEVVDELINLASKDLSKPLSQEVEAKFSTQLGKRVSTIEDVLTALSGKASITSADLKLLQQIPEIRNIVIQSIFKNIRGAQGVYNGYIAMLKDVSAEPTAVSGLRNKLSKYFDDTVLTDVEKKYKPKAPKVPKPAPVNAANQAVQATIAQNRAMIDEFASSYGRFKKQIQFLKNDTVLMSKPASQAQSEALDMINQIMEKVPEKEKGLWAKIGKVLKSSWQAVTGMSLFTAFLVHTIFNLMFRKGVHSIGGAIGQDLLDYKTLLGDVWNKVSSGGPDEQPPAATPKPVNQTSGIVNEIVARYSCLKPQNITLNGSKVVLKIIINNTAQLFDATWKNNILIFGPTGKEFDCAEIM